MELELPPPPPGASIALTEHSVVHQLDPHEHNLQSTQLFLLKYTDFTDFT